MHGRPVPHADFVFMSSGFVCALLAFFATQLQPGSSFRHAMSNTVWLGFHLTRLSPRVLIACVLHPCARRDALPVRSLRAPLRVVHCALSALECVLLSEHFFLRLFCLRASRSAFRAASRAAFRATSRAALCAFHCTERVDHCPWLVTPARQPQFDTVWLGHRPECQLCALT